MTISCREWFLQQPCASRGRLGFVLELVRYCFQVSTIFFSPTHHTLLVWIKDVYGRLSFQILKILRGENDTESIAIEDSQSVENGDDEVYPSSSSELHLNLALLDVDDGGEHSFSSVERTKRRPSLEDYFKERWSRSSSFN